MHAHRRLLHPEGESVKIAILYSGGKDSTLTLHYYASQGWDVACLLALIPENQDSFLFQNTNEQLVQAQAAALQIPLITQSTKGEEETELDDLATLLDKARERYRITGVAVGALASDYQHVRISHACEEIGLKIFAPLWHKAQARILREVIDAGYDVRMSRIAAMGLDKSWLGRRMTLEDVGKLEALHERLGLHVAGEGGEFETIVLDGPLFKHPVFMKSEVVMETPERGDLRLLGIQ